MTRIGDSTFLFVSSRSADTLGRVERRWLKVWEELVRSGATVLLICPPRSPLEVPARRAGVQIAPYRLDRLNLVRTASRLRKYMRRYQPAVAHSTGYEADIVLRHAARDLPVKVVTSVLCGSWPPRGLGAIGSSFKRRLDRHTLSRCDAVMTDCRELADRMVEIAEVDRARIVVDPPSVSLARVLSEAEVPAALPEGRPLVGYAGALEVSRGLGTLTALRQQLVPDHPEVRVVVAGSGPARTRLHVAERSGAIDMLGAVPSVPAVLAGLDVCVFPSTVAGTPTPLLEAVALGRPVVASAVPGIAELFEPDSEIILVRPGDTAELAEGVRRVLADPGSAAARAERARMRVVDEYTSTAAVARHLELYRALIASL
ncbi:MAG: glycosyltransferase family 4 protein [Coriobacteriia bacterium]